jgi:hypothetical protein
MATGNPARRLRAVSMIVGAAFRRLFFVVAAVTLVSSLVYVISPNSARAQPILENAPSASYRIATANHVTNCFLTAKAYKSGTTLQGYAEAYCDTELSSMDFPTVKAHACLSMYNPSRAARVGPPPPVEYVDSVGTRSAAAVRPATCTWQDWYPWPDCYYPGPIVTWDDRLCPSSGLYSTGTQPNTMFRVYATACAIDVYGATNCGSYASPAQYF